MQAAVKKEAAALAVEEQAREKEAVEAENAAAQAKIAENEAMVRLTPTSQFLWGARKSTPFLQQIACMQNRSIQGSGPSISIPAPPPPLGHVSPACMYS